MNAGEDIDQLPLMTPDLPGTEGQIRVEPTHFVVEEVPLYEPCGTGEHVYIRLTKVGLTTPKVADGLAEIFDVPMMDIGYAGLKDKHASATQTFSIRRHDLVLEEVERRVTDELSVQVHWVRRHNNKVRVGHLLGNHFKILITQPVADAADRASAIFSALSRNGLPNYYGAQRFGLHRDNAQRGRESIFGRPIRDRRMKHLLHSAYQSALFNLYLRERIQRGEYFQVYSGDVAKKTDTGGLFDVVDEAVETERFRRREITFTGPIYGCEMKRAGGRPGVLESEIMASEGLTEAVMKKAGLSGTRRPGRVFPQNLSLSQEDEGLRVSFFLPKGSFATTLLREVMKSPVEGLQDTNEE